MDADRAARAEQERIHRDREVRQHLDQAGRLEALMQGRAFGRQRAVVLPLPHRPQNEVLAHGQSASAAGAATARSDPDLGVAKPLF